MQMPRPNRFSAAKASANRLFRVAVAVALLLVLLHQSACANASTRAQSAGASTCATHPAVGARASTPRSADQYVTAMPRGGAFGFPAGWHPFGYAISSLGRRFLDFEGSRDGDVGRFLSTLVKGGRKSRKALKEQWLEITRVSRKRQSIRIYRTLDGLIEFCLDAGFIE